MTDGADARRASRSVPASGPTAVVVAALLWGTTGTATHFAPGVPAAVIGAVTFGLGGLVMAVLAGRRVVAVLRDRESRPFVRVAALSLAVYAIVFYAALAWAGVALGTIVAIGTSPTFAGLVDRIARARPAARAGSPAGVGSVPRAGSAGRHVTRRWGTANVVSVVGIALVTVARAGATDQDGASGASAPDGGLLVAGVLAGLGAGLTYAVYTWAVGAIVSGERGPTGAGPGGVRGVVGAVFGLAAVPLVVVAVVVGHDDLATAANWPVFLYLALVPTVLGHTVYAIGLRSVGASTATLLSLLEPVVTAVLAVAVVGEHLGPVGWIGVVVVVVGLGILGVPARVEDLRVLRAFRR